MSSPVALNANFILTLEMQISISPKCCWPTAEHEVIFKIFYSGTIDHFSEWTAAFYSGINSLKRYISWQLISSVMLEPSYTRELAVTDSAVGPK